MKQLYVVKCKGGSWDTAHEWVSGVFDDETLAKEHIDKLYEASNLVKQAAPIYPNYEDYYPNDGEMYEKLYEAYYDYFWPNQDQMEFNSATIHIYDLNVGYNTMHWNEPQPES